MISALQNGKYSVESREDVITASVFDTLLLLPGKLVWRILRDACFGKEGLPEEAGALRFDDVAFWPHWDPADTDRTQYVEPDVFIPFEALDLVVEAKLPGNIQNYGQWNKEIIAYHNVYGSEGKKVFLLAIDGLEGKTKTEIVTVQIAGRGKPVTIVKTDWARLLEVLQREQSRQKREGGNGTEYRILRMAVTWLTEFGYAMKWLDELVKEDETNHESIASLLSITDFESDLKCMRNFGVPPDVDDSDDEDLPIYDL